MGLSVAGERCIDAGDGGTLVWDPKVVENLTDEECKCIITKYYCDCTGCATILDHSKKFVMPIYNDT